jgi:UDP-N-acetylglucosamine--N-acetylmuramyl-(pentapeptide) pyrophosphoryl-undecaprenol N-acetylglucosamine transferase
VSHLVIMAAGTGGHIIPGLAVAEEMQRRGWTVSWIGTETGLENKLVPAKGLALDALAFSGMRGKGVGHALRGVLGFARALFQAGRVFRQRKADAVLGMGGYVCLPGGLMAWLTRRPLMLINADAEMLLSNRVLAGLARRIGFGFDGAAAATTPRAVVTGNPVRSEIEALPSPPERLLGHEGPLRVLVVGGSLGARAINAVVPATLALWPQAERPLVRHQTGAANLADVQASYAAAGVQAEVLPFIDDMASALAEADIVLCRAGAITVSELCAADNAAILVPLVVSTTSHQRDNARFLAQHSAGIHLPQEELNPQRLFALLNETNRPQLALMGDKARALSRPRAAARVADEIEGLLK